MRYDRLPFILARAGLAAILLPSLLHAQVTFERTYGGWGWEEGFSVVQTYDGGYAIAGFTATSGSGDKNVYLVKTDANGDTLWTRTIGGGNHDVARALRQTADSGYIIAGQTNSFGAGGYDLYLIKTDARGDTLWTRTFGGESTDVAFAVDECDDRGFIIAGQTRPVGTKEQNVYVVRTDETGIPLWTRTYRGGGQDGALSVARTADSGFILCGDTDSVGGGESDVYLIRLNAAGDTLWTRTYGGAGAERGHSVQQTSDGGFVVAGSTRPFSASPDDVWLIRMDASGDTLWTRTFGGDSSDVGRAVRQTPDRGFVVAGQTSSFGVRYTDGWLIKTDSAGDTMWSRTYGGAFNDRLSSMQLTADQGYILAGTTNSFGAGLYDVYLIKTDSLGSSVALAEPNKGTPGTETTGPTVIRGVLRIGDRGQKTGDRAELLDISGRKVLDLKPGANDVRALAPGVYFYRLDTPGFTDVKKAVLAR